MDCVWLSMLAVLCRVCIDIYIRVIGRMTSLEWFSIWETSNNIINFNDVRKRLWKLVSMMMFSPCVFCVLPCVTSTFTVSKLARIIKQASRVGGCERVFTPVRWRQVRLSCIKWRSTFFYIFSCVHRSVGSSSSGWTAAAPTVLLGWRFCPADTPRENNVIMTLSPRRVPVGRIGPAPLTNQNRFSTTNENRGFPTNQVTGFRTN